MKRTVSGKIVYFCFGLIPTLPACTITDIAGNVDAGVGAGGALGTGGAVAVATGGAAEATTGGAVAVATGGAVAVATGGAVAVATGGSTASSITLPTWATPDGCVTGNENSQFVGTWEGYIQGSPIGDEESSIRLTIVGANSTGLCGTVVIGTHTAPVTLPVATDPTGIYPPESITPWTCMENPSRSIARILGLGYTIQAGNIDAQRATIEISYNQEFQSWCAIQTPYPNSFGYDCLPMASGGGSVSGVCYNIVDGEKKTVSCVQKCLCNGYGEICACGPQGCTATPKSGRMMFDLLFNGDQAMGLFGDPGIDMHNAQNVVFNRVPARTCVASSQACNSDSDCCSELCELGDGGAGVCQ